MFVMHTISAPARRIRSVTVASWARHEALEDGRAAGQRDAGDRDGVLHRQAHVPRGALAVLRAHAAAPHDGVERILLGTRALRPPRARPATGAGSSGSCPSSVSSNGVDGLSHRQQLTRLLARRARSPSHARAPADRTGSMRGIISRSRTACAPSRPRKGAIVCTSSSTSEKLPGAILLAVAVGVAAGQPHGLRAVGRPPRCRAARGTRCRLRRRDRRPPRSPARSCSGAPTRCRPETPSKKPQIASLPS